MSKPTAFDLFAGGGGLSVGLKRAGFNVVGAIELDKSAFETYRANHPEVTTYLQDVRRLTGKCILGLTEGNLDLLAACPPCQGFCSLTRRKSDDPRNQLVLEVARLVEELRPRVLMMENIPGLADKKGRSLLEELIQRLTDADYVVRWRILQVADYGVPQRRRRLVLVAGRGFSVEMPAPTHSNNRRNRLMPWKTVAETISGLAAPITLSQATRAGGPQRFNWHVVRDMTARNLERLRSAVPGKTRGHFPVDLRPKCHQGGDDGFHNSYGRLRWDQASVTITAGCTTISKGRFGHPQEDRTLSAYEAALLQTFPPEYVFTTPFMEKVCDIIGNALPCDFAEIVARQCLEALIGQAHS